MVLIRLNKLNDGIRAVFSTGKFTNSQTKAIDNGSIFFHIKDITWSYLTLGKEVLIQIKTTHIKVPFKLSFTITVKNKPVVLPRNSITKIKLLNII